MLEKSPKYFKIAIFLFLIGATVTPAQQKNESAVFLDVFLADARRCLTADQYDSSIIYFQKVSDVAYQTADWNKFLIASGGLSRCYFSTKSSDTALSILINARKIVSEHTSDTCLELGTSYTFQGYIYNFRYEYDLALEYLTKGIELNKKNFGDKHDKLAGDYYTMALVYRSLGRPDDAIENLSNSLDIQKNPTWDNWQFTATTLSELGGAYDDKNQFSDAMKCYDQALSVLTMHGKDKTLVAGLCFFNMSASCGNKGDYLRAIEYGEKGIQFYQTFSRTETPDFLHEYVTLAESYIALGDYEKAKEYLVWSLNVFLKKYPENTIIIGTVYQLLSETEKQTGHLSLALEYSLKGIQILENSPRKDHPRIGFMYELAAGVYADSKKYDNALNFYNKALAARQKVEKAKSHNDIASIYTSMAAVHMEMHQYNHAEEYLKKAEAIQATSPEKNELQFGETQKQLGNLYSVMQMNSDALRSYQKALNILSGSAVILDVNSIPETDKSIYKTELLDVMVLKAKTFELMYGKSKKMSDLNSALAHYQRAMDLVDDARRQFGAEGSKYHLAEKSKSVYAEGCRIALELFKKTGEETFKEQAFLIADRSKANILLEKLFDGEAKNFAGIPDSLLNQEKELLKTIAYQETQLYKVESQKGEKLEVHSILQSNVFLLRQKHQELIKLFERDYPKYYQLKYSGYSLSVAQAKDRLPVETGMIEYFTGEQAAYLFFLSKDTLVARTINSPAKLDGAIARFTSALKKYETNDYLNSGYELYSSLLKPVNRLTSECSKVIIVPDGNLYYLPFEALPIQKYRSSNLPDFTTLNYVITKNDISYSYSAEFYLKMGETNFGSNSTPSFIGFAPVFRDSTHNGDLLANRSYVEESGLSDVRAITLDGKKFNELKYSQEEVESIRHSFDEHSLPAQQFLHTAATESNFKQFSKAYDIVHIATHGFINEKNPKFSAILFSQPATSTADDDGILYVDETFNLDLKAKLVVLSSCESGLGKLVQGEGMIALTRGLFYAGAKNIIFSLWKVSDKQTYLLMDEFYKQMLSGKSYSASLREAKLRMISSKDSAFPSKWSGFVLVGE